MALSRVATLRSLLASYLGLFSPSCVNTCYKYFVIRYVVRTVNTQRHTVLLVRKPPYFWRAASVLQIRYGNVFLTPTVPSKLRFEALGDELQKAKKLIDKIL